VGEVHNEDEMERASGTQEKKREVYTWVCHLNLQETACKTWM